MNLSQFMKEVDRVSGVMSKDELIRFVHDFARTLPQKERELFLSRLKGMHGQKAACNSQDDGAEKEFLCEYETIKTELKRIEDGEMCLSGSLNEEYDDWYNSDADEFLYEDPEGVLDVIADACDFVSQCADYEEYGKGYEIAEILVGLEIAIEGEYLDYADDPMPIDELEYYHLGDLDYKSFAVEAVYAAYHANELSERADAVYRMIENTGINGFTLEMVMQSREELPETEEFLKLWVSYLGERTSGLAQRLLKEALELIGDSKQLLENARKYLVQHPGLYEQYICSNLGKENDGELYEVGKEALAAIEVKYIVRSRIALLMGQMALRLELEEEAEKCWMEAFRSDTRVVNYMRLSMECKDFSKRMRQGAYTMICMGS